MVGHNTKYQTVSNAYFSFQRLKRQEYLCTHLNEKVIILMIYILVTGVLQRTVKKVFYRLFSFRLVNKVRGRGPSKRECMECFYIWA